jgi:hypothetical protein
MQQAGAQPALQAFEMAADHRARQVQRFRRAGQAASVGDLDERSDGAQVIH